MSTEKNLEQLVEKIRQEYDVKNIPVNIEKIISALNINVSYAPSDKYSGMLKRDAAGGILIGLNASESSKRQRFTMTHELGHYFIDTNKNTFVDNKTTIDYRDHKLASNDPAKERVANAFAATLLMPKASLKKDFWHIVNQKKVFIDDHLTALANRYEVSREAMKWRLVNLGLIKI